MAIPVPKLSKKALMRIVEASQAQGLSPDAIVLKFIPAPANSSANALIKRTMAEDKDPKQVKAADDYFRKAKPKMRDSEAGKLALKLFVATGTAKPGLKTNEAQDRP